MAGVSSPTHTQFRAADIQPGSFEIAIFQPLFDRGCKPFQPVRL
jgi:hypothetical protein